MNGNNEQKRIRQAAEVDQFLRSEIPPLFRLHDPILFPNPTALSVVDGLELECRCDKDGNEQADYRGGVMLFGPTGSGKTRAAFRMLERWIRDDGWLLRFKYLSGPLLKRKLADAAKAGKAHELIEQILDSSDDVIFIDDLSQARFTASFAENLFELIDRIHRERIPLVVTVQTTGADLIRKWCADDRALTDTAEAIARRLRDYCVKVRFPKPARPSDGEA